MHKDITLKINPSQRRGLINKLKINLRILMMLNVGLKFKESIADFKNNWLIVSQRLVRAIKKRMTKRPSLI